MRTRIGQDSHSNLRFVRPRKKTLAIWFGPRGLRAGWAIAVFAALLAAGFVAARAAVSYLDRRVPETGRKVDQASQPGDATVIHPTGKLESEAILVATVLIATWIMSALEKRPFASYGLGGGPKLRYCLSGASVGFAMLSLLIGILIAGGWIVVHPVHAGITAVLLQGIVWLGAYFLVAVFEETLFRGYVQHTLARGIGFWWAALVLSIAFAFAHGHNAGESPVGLYSAALIELVFCVSLSCTGSLWWAIGFHTLWDWGETFFYGSASSGNRVSGHLFATDAISGPLLSGGMTGPEGSIFVLLPIALTAGTLYALLRPKRRDRPGV